MLKAKDPVPAVVTQDDTGAPFQFSSLKGKRVVLFFYPKADTPGCTKEACGFRDEHEKFTAQDTVIVGVSPDKEAAQAKFRKKFDLPYILLADKDHSVAEAFGVWGEKKFMGKTYMGVNRTTFVIGKTGKIEHVFEGVKPEGHAAEVIAYLTQNS
ncbi:peroxiredoxin [Bryobacterales bacterium F-183]|nr:peroxiredoxin [Bryobacterales bacterium F-183]